MSETFILAFTTFFVAIAPLDIAAIFTGLTLTETPRFRRTMAIRGVMVSTVILMVFVLIGEFMLTSLGISLAALKISGGILLLLIAIDMVFVRSSGGTSTTDEESHEAIERQDISVFPLATPLIAGPGAMGAVILLMANTAGHVVSQMVVVLALLMVLLITLILLLLANRVQELFGVIGLSVIGRVFGVILAALAVQFVLDGIVQSGVLSR
jgi:multiple antibiotic resistance protein